MPSDEEEPGTTFTPQGVHPASDEPSEGGEDPNDENDDDAAPKVMDLGEVINSLAKIGDDPDLKFIQRKLKLFLGDIVPLWDKMLREVVENSRATRAAVDPTYAAALAARKKAVGK